MNSDRILIRPYWKPRQQLTLLDMLVFHPHELLNNDRLAVRGTGAWLANSIIFGGLLLLWLYGVLRGLNPTTAILALILLVGAWYFSGQRGAHHLPWMNLLRAYRWALGGGIATSLGVGLLIFGEFIENPAELTMGTAVPLVLVLIPLGVGLAIADACGGRGVLALPVLGIPALVAAYFGAGINAGLMTENADIPGITKIILSTLEGGLISVIVVTAVYGIASDLSKVITRSRLPRPSEAHPPFELPPLPQPYESRPLPPAPVPPRIENVLAPVLVTLLSLVLLYLVFALLKRGKRPV